MMNINWKKINFQKIFKITKLKLKNWRMKLNISRNNKIKRMK